MITLVNEKFIHVEKQEVTSKKNPEGPKSCKTQFMTYEKILRQPVLEEGKEEKNNELTYCRPKLILNALTKTEDYNSYTMAISSAAKDSKQPMTALMQKPGKHDTPIYIIAFPYKGFLKPIPTSPQYRIYKGLVCKSDRYNIKLNKKKYNRLLYLVIVPNVSLFDAEHKYHVDKISIDLTAYHTIYDEDKTTGVDSTTMRFTLHSDMTFETAWMYEQLDADTVDTEKIKETPLFTAYVPTAAPKKPMQKKPYGQKPSNGKRFNKNNKKPAYNKQDGKKNYPQKNASGNKKPFTPKNHPDKKFDAKTSKSNNGNTETSYQNNIGTSLDDMLKKAFSDSRSGDLKKRQNGGKGRRHR